MNDRDPAQKLPLRVKLSYGAPSFAGAGMAIPIAIHLTIFYSDVILVPLGLIALVKAVARAFDALTDPLMGWITDSTRSRWGRRRPWILFGAPAAGLAFYAMFSPPESVAGLNGAAWLAVTYVLYYIFHTVYVIPHYGLGAELTLDYHERSTLFGVREGFVVLGTLVAAVAPPIFIGALGSERSGYSAFAALLACLLVLLYVNLVAQVRERPEFAARLANPLVPGLRRVMRNGAFRILLLVYLTSSITGAIPGLMMPYFTKYVLQPDDPNLWLAIYLASYFGAGFLFLPVWVWLARRFEKKPVWLASFVPGVTGSLSLFFMGPGDLWPTLAVLIWAGCAFGAGLFLGPAMQADVIDYDELHTGKRREAQYGALWSIMTKFMVIPSMSVPLAILASVGYVPNVPQSGDVQLAIRAIFGLAPASTALIAFLLALRYPITKRVHDDVLKGIAAHGRRESAMDPISGKRVSPPSDQVEEEELSWFLDHFSFGELRLAAAKGAKTVARRIVLLQGIAIAVLALAVFGLSREVRIEQDPGIMAVLQVVVAGLALAGWCFHFIRWRAVRRLTPVPRASLDAHLRNNEAFSTARAPVLKSV